jgi:NAD(P)-dependent dehydrogenase (short-subunit alcohol dehydrogenase family)
MNTAIITGGNTGLGFECARALAETHDWHVVIACRDAEIESVRNFARDYAAEPRPPLRAIVCNAATQIVTGRTYTADGFETTFAVNHLGHFLLVNLMLAQMAPPARIVVVSSGTHDPAQTTGMPPPVYRSARYLARPDEDSKPLEKSVGSNGSITVNAFDPGLMPGTGLARDYGSLARFAWRFVLPALRPFVPNVNSAARSGRALANMVTDPRFERISGKYFQGSRDVPSSKDSYDPVIATELWESSASMVKVAPGETILRLRSTPSAA